jgi:hypothetical protein
MREQQTLVLTETEEESPSTTISTPEPVAQPKTLTDWLRWALGGSSKSERNDRIMTMTPDGKIVRSEYSKR